MIVHGDPPDPAPGSSSKTPRDLTEIPSVLPLGRSVRIADSAGVTGAIVAALCCAGTPIIVGALAAVGLSFLRRDAVLWPIMLISLVVALWGFWQGRRFHRSLGPFIMGAAGAMSLASGVIVVHGPPAMAMIYTGAILLVLATCWTIWARRACYTASSEVSRGR